MVILDPTTGRNVDVPVPHRPPTSRQQERDARKEAAIAEKARLRAAAWTTIRRAELDSGAL